MKKIFTLTIAAAVLFIAVMKVQAQPTTSSFTVQHDTMTVATSGSYGLINGINNLTSSGITIQWKVIASNFPSDWVPTMGFCDNSSCYTGSTLWPSGATFQTVYTPGLGDFHMTVDVSTVTTPGTYYVKVRFSNLYAASDTAIETFVITKIPASVPVVKSESEVALYPNPANNELNVVYDASADIKTIAVYNIIGKVMTVYKVTGNTGANLNLENISSGIYFVRLMNSHGDVVTTRKFTKQ